LLNPCFDSVATLRFINDLMLELLLSLKWPLIVLQAIVSPVLIILILLQSSKGDDLGSVLSGGGGGGSSILGTGGASKFLVKGTIIFAALFMINSVLLAKIFKESSTASIGGSVSEPLAPANAINPPPATAPVTSGNDLGTPTKK